MTDTCAARAVRGDGVCVCGGGRVARNPPGSHRTDVRSTFALLQFDNATTQAVFEQNLAELGVEATDLTLLHAPTSTGGGSIVYPGFSGSPSCDCAAPVACAAMQQQWAALEEMYRANKSRAIGGEAVGSGQWAVGSGQCWAVGSGQ